MLKLITYNDEANSKILECNELKNDIIFIKYNISENSIIKINQKQFVIMFYKGKVLDIKNNEGIYIVKNIEDFEDDIENEWKELIIRDSEEEELCVIYLNLNEITHRYNFDKYIKIINWENNIPEKKHIKLQGEYKFLINNPNNLLKNVIGLRTHFTKQEFIEKIRVFVLNYIEEGINQICSEYKFNINDFVENECNLKSYLKTNKYDDKLYSYGVEITYFNIKKIETLNRKIKFF